MPAVLPQPLSRFARIASLLVLPLAVASCTAFDAQYINTQPPATANPAAPLSGKWEGSWQSDNTDYHGPLQAMIVPTQATVVKDGVPAQQYRAWLQLTFLDMGKNDYHVLLNAMPGKDGRIHFEGKLDRGNFMGGIFTYDGYIDEDTFFCDYNSNRDCGTFKMHRVTQQLLHQ